MLKDKYKIHVMQSAWKDEAYEAAKGVVNFYEKNRPHKRWAGKDYNKDKYQDTYKGLLGQIAFREAIKSATPSSLHDKLAFSALYTEDLSSLPVWDFKADTFTGDVKVISPGDRRICMWVKKSEFKGLDWYVGIKLWSGEEYSFKGDTEYSLCGMASGEEVKNARIFKGPYADAYELRLTSLKPIKFSIDEQNIVLE